MTSTSTARSGASLPVSSNARSSDCHEPARAAQLAVASSPFRANQELSPSVKRSNYEDTTANPVQAFRAAIHTALKYAPEAIEPGRLHRFATSSKRGDLAGWCKLFLDFRGGVFGCNRTGRSETWWAQGRGPLTRQQRAELARHIAKATSEHKRQQSVRWRENKLRIAKLLGDLLPLSPGDPVVRYLASRGFDGVWPLPACLRLHPALPYWTNTGEKLGTFPAMVAPLVREGRVVALHRTYLTADGRKADVPAVKKVTAAAGPLAGACVPLHRPTQGIIAVAEGIETALAGVQVSGIPTVAAYCASNLANYMWPTAVRRIVVFADADTAGTTAAQSLRARALRAGLSVAVLTPTKHGTDWCDVWAERTATATTAPEGAA